MDRDLIGLGALSRRFVGRDVVRSEEPGKLVIAERLEVAGGGQVAGEPIAPQQGAVGDLADEPLHEFLEAELGTARIDLDVELPQLAERLEPVCIGAAICAREGRTAAASVAGPIFRVDDAARMGRGRRLIHRTNPVSRRLGTHPDHTRARRQIR